MFYAATLLHLTKPKTFLLATISLTAISGCHRSTREIVADTLPIDVVACSAVRRANGIAICELPADRRIRIVLPPGAVSARVSSEENAIEAHVTARPDDGAVLSIEVPNGATRMVVEASAGGRPARAIVHVAAAERLEWFEEARTARGKGDVERARSLALAHATDSALVARALAKGLLARLALGGGRSDDAFPLFREAIALHRSADRISSMVDDSFALAFALHQRSQRFAEARAVLDAIGTSVALYAEGRARAPYYRGSLASETGDRRSALALLREAERAARRLGMTRLERNARGALALEMQEVGRARASLPVLAALEKELDEAARSSTDGEGPSACERVEVANNRGWGALLVNEAAASQGEPPTEDARGPLERALAIEGCSDVYVRGFALANLARLALSNKDIVTAERRLAEARAGVKEPRGTERIAWLDLEGRLLLARHRPQDALEVFDKALALARASVMRLPEWSLLVSRSEALQTLKRPTDAVASLRAAEDVLDDAILLVPLGEGRGTFAGGRFESARALVGLLVKRGKPLEAAASAKRAQARVLASVEGAARIERLDAPERAAWEEAVRAFRAARAAMDAEAAGDWKLPADRLAKVSKTRSARERELRSAIESAMTVLERFRPPMKRVTDEVSHGTIELDIHPDIDGFVAIARYDRTGTAFRIPSPRGRSQDERARALLEPISTLLQSARLLRVRAYGAWRSVDIHALPFQRQPLLARLPVEYSVGLGASLATSSGGVRIVIGDPTSDLPFAFAEANEVARALGRAPDGGATPTVRVFVRDQATSRAVSEALRGAERLHYAGHGVFAGDEGGESALPLAAGGRLTAQDILSLAPAAPRAAVLTGCEVGRNAGEAEGLGLAQAFVVAGSVEVLAPTRPVPDALAEHLAVALYRTAELTPLHGPAREALLALAREDPASDWAAFRVLVP